MLYSPITDLISNKTNQHPRDTLCNYIRQNRQFHFLGLMDLGFKIQKTNFGVRICILEIPCVPIFRQSPQICPKMDLGLEIQKTNVEIRISIPDILCMPISPLIFLAQICPKMDLGLEIEKPNFGIRISILEIPCVPIFRQNGQLSLFWPKFTQKGI